ncbi:hypothetical protein LguiB_013352 [Lonicera macranthoides]
MSTPKRMGEGMLLNCSGIFFSGVVRLWRLRMDLIATLMIVFYRIVFGFGRSRNYGIPNANEIQHLLFRNLTAMEARNGFDGGSVGSSVVSRTGTSLIRPDELSGPSTCRPREWIALHASFTKLSDQTKLNPGIQGRCRASTSSIPIVTKALNLLCPYKDKQNFSYLDTARHDWHALSFSGICWLWRLAIYRSDSSSDDSIRPPFRNLTAMEARSGSDSSSGDSNACRNAQCSGQVFSHRMAYVTLTTTSSGPSTRLPRDWRMLHVSPLCETE